MTKLAMVHTSIEHRRDWCRRLLILGCQKPSAQQPLSPGNRCSRLLKTTAGTLAVLAWLGDHLLDQREDNIDAWVDEADRLVRFAPRPDPVVLMMGPRHSTSGQYQTLALDKPEWIAWWVDR